MKQIIKLGVGIIIGVVAAIISVSCDPSDNGQKNTDADILSFTFDGITATAIIEPGTRSVTASANESCDLSSLTPEFKLSAGAKAEVNGTEQLSGQTQNDFRTPVIYDVFSEDGQLRKSWTVTISGGIPGETGKEIFARLPLPVDMRVDFILADDALMTWITIKDGTNFMFEHDDTEINYRRQDLYVRSSDSYHLYYRDVSDWETWVDDEDKFRFLYGSVTPVELLGYHHHTELLSYARGKYAEGISFDKQEGTYTIAGVQCSKYQDKMGVVNYYVGPHELCFKMDSQILDKTLYEVISYTESAQSLASYINDAVAQNP